MRLLVALGLITIALAGCAEEDFSREMLIVSIVASEGPVSVGVPLWLAQEGTSAEEWLEHAVIRSGNGTVYLRQAGQGTALWIEATASITVEVTDLISTATDAKPRAYLDGRYTLGTGATDAPLAVQESGAFDLHWQYEASSDGCSLFINQSWIGPEGEAAALTKPFAGMSPPPHCT